MKKLPFFARLLSLRVAANMTQRQAAIACGVAQQAYQGWETGRSEPRLSSLRALSRVFGIDIGELKE